MNESAPNTCRESYNNRPLWLLLGGFAVLHALMMLYDRSHPEVFLRADRATSRWDAIQRLLSASSWDRVLAALSSQGNIGDYALHAGAFLAGHQPGVILVQVALTLASALALFYLAGCLGVERRYCVVAAGLYLALPHTLILPHQLVTEPWSSSLLLISTALFVEASTQNSWRRLALAGLLLGFATLVRPVTLLWPWVAALLCLRERWLGRGLGFAAFATLPVLFWCSFIAYQTGTLGLGESNHSMGRNLYTRVRTIADTLPATDRALIQAQFLTADSKGSLTPGQYLQFILKNPRAASGQFLRDAGVFVGKSGIERLMIDYLGTGDAARHGLQDYDRGWRSRLDRQGPLAAGRYLWKELGPEVILSSVLGALFMLLLMIFAIIGSIHLIAVQSRSTPSKRLASAMLIALPVYVFAFSQIVPAVSSRHRAPAEFALVILAIVGAALLLRRRKREPTQGHGNSQAPLLQQS